MRGTLDSIRKPDASFAANHRVASPKHTTGRPAVDMPPAGEDQTLPLFAGKWPHFQQAGLLLEVARVESSRMCVMT